MSFNRRVCHLAVVALAAVAIAGCSAMLPAKDTASAHRRTSYAVAHPRFRHRRGHRGAHPAQIASGRGPQAHYSVQHQPGAGTCHYRWVNRSAGDVLPDPRCTPGARNPRVTQSTLASTICRTGYTSSIRPPTDVTDAEKQTNARSYGYRGSLYTAEYDHLISLELGGDPNDARNLFVEPNKVGASSYYNPKDSVENWLNWQVCNYLHLASRHRGYATAYLPLASAQHLIATNWITAERLAPRYFVHR